MTIINYAYTIKCIKSNYFAKKEELIMVMQELLTYHKATQIEYVFEEDRLGRLHIHGHMMARKGLLLSRFKRPYYHIHLDWLKTTSDTENWTLYIHKDIKTDSELAARQIQLEYSFI